MNKRGKLVCNCCGEELARCGARYKDHLHIVKNWGYLSEWDGTTEEMDICTHCLMKWVQTFALAPERYPTTELL